MSDSRQTLIRPGGGEGAARIVYNRRRRDELHAERARLRTEELDRLERRIATIDLDLALTRRLAWRELATDLTRHGFNVASQHEPPLPLERDLRRGQPAHADPRATAAAEEAASRGRLIRIFIPPTIRVR